MSDHYNGWNDNDLHPLPRMKICPTCHCLADLKDDSDVLEYYDEDGVADFDIQDAKNFWVECSNEHCNAQSRTARTPEVAIEFWNNRYMQFWHMDYFESRHRFLFMRKAYKKARFKKAQTRKKEALHRLHEKYFNELMGW